MAITKQGCKNHSQKFTAKRCFHCKDHICLDCQQRQFHHIFCSVKCIIEWRIKDLLSVFRLSKGFSWVVAIILFSNILMYHLLSSKIDNSKAIDVSIEDTISDSLKPATVPDGFIVDSLRQSVLGKFKINISANENAVLTLTHNGNFAESLLPGETEFSFDDISLDTGLNNFAIWGLGMDGRSYLVDSFSITYKTPRINYLAKPVYRVRTKQKVVAFTFDGGSSNKGTQERSEERRVGKECRSRWSPYH